MISEWRTITITRVSVRGDNSVDEKDICRKIRETTTKFVEIN